MKIRTWDLGYKLILKMNIVNLHVQLQEYENNLVANFIVLAAYVKLVLIMV